MTEQPRDSNVKSRLAEWGIVGIIGDYRGAKLTQLVRTTSEVTIHKERPSFSSECLDCGQSPHVSPDDHAIGICLRCGRDHWL